MNNRMKNYTQCDIIVGSITAIDRRNWLEAELRACVYWPSLYLALALTSSENLPTQGKEWGTFVKWNQVPSSRTVLSSDLVLDINSSQLLSSRKFLSDKTLVTASTASGIELPRIARVWTKAAQRNTQKSWDGLSLMEKPWHPKAQGVCNTQVNRKAGWTWSLLVPSWTRRQVYLISKRAVSAREQSSGWKYLSGESGEIPMVDIFCIHSQHSHMDQRKGLSFLCTSLLGKGDLTIFPRVWDFWSMAWLCPS